LVEFFVKAGIREEGQIFAFKSSQKLFNTFNPLAKENSEIDKLCL